MSLPIEKRLKLLSDVSNLMLVGSIHVYGIKSSRVRAVSQKKRVA